MNFLGSLILIYIFTFVISESFVYNNFRQKDVTQVCPVPLPPLNNPTTKPFPKNINSSSKSQLTNIKSVSNNLHFKGSKIILTEKNPRFAISLFNIEIGTPLTVCLEDLQNLNGPMELFIPKSLNFLALTQYILYDSDGLNNSKGSLLNIKTIDTSYSVYKNTISISGCFTIKNIGDKTETNALLFRWKEIHSRFCSGQKNIAIAYLIDDDTPKFEATPDGDCEVIILASPSTTPVIEILSFNFNSENDMIFKSGLNDKILFEVSQTNISEWINIYLHTPVLTTLVQAGISFIIDCAQGILNMDGDQLIYVCVNEQKGIIASPSYNGFNSDKYLETAYVIGTANHKNIYTQFTVLEINGNASLFFEDDSGMEFFYNISEVGDSVNVTYEIIRITFFLDDPETDYLLIGYINYFQKDPTINPLITFSTKANQDFDETSSTTFSDESKTKSTSLFIESSTIPTSNEELTKATTTKINNSTPKLFSVISTFSSLFLSYFFI